MRKKEIKKGNISSSSSSSFWLFTYVVTHGSM
jgi:hypothetical protein